LKLNDKDVALRSINSYIQCPKPKIIYHKPFERRMLIKPRPLFMLAVVCSAIVFNACNKEPENEEPVDPKVEKFTVPEDFVIEHLYSPSDEERGSWVSMTFDDHGRMIASDQFGGIYRLTIPEIGNDSIPLKIDSLHFPLVGEAVTDTSKKK